MVKNYVANTMGALALGAASYAPAATITTLSEDTDSFNITRITTNDTGVTIDNLLHDEQEMIDNIALNTGNSVADVMNAIDVTILGSPLGDVDSNWFDGKNLPYQLTFDHIDGPSFLYDNFLNGSTFATFTEVDKSILGGNPLVPLGVDNDLVQLYTLDIGNPQFNQEATTFGIVPEPTSLAMAALPMLYLASRRRRN